MESIREALQSYGIYPVEIQKVTNKLYYIKDHRAEYALKKSNLTSETLHDWEYVYHQAYQNNFTDILPVYLTTDQKLYQKINDTIYYVTPWIMTKGDEIPLESTMRGIGHIHKKTKRSQFIETKNVKKQFQSYQTFCETNMKTITDTVEQFEQNLYMSPFELLVCTQYRDMVQVMNILMNRVNLLLNELNSDEIEWSYSLCHGSLQPSHILRGNQTFLINWEHVTYNNTINDLYYFISHYSIYYDRNPQLFTERFHHYTNENELTKSELYLLIIYLLNVTPYIHAIEQYTNSNSNKSMIERVKELQQLHRQYMFGMALSKYVEEQHETIDFEDLEDIES